MKIKRPNHHFSPEYITELSRCEIFVFGSNLEGQHTGGAARMAYEKFGAKWGVGDGPTGRCYAIPTMHGGIEEIRPYVDKFIEYAKAHPMNRFLLTRVGCGIAGFEDIDMACLFKEAREIPNIAIPHKWLPYMCIEIILGFEVPKGHEEAPKVITEEVLKKLCREHLYEIGARIGNYLPKISVRYVSGNKEFGYTGLENCFFSNDDFYVWESDDKWADEHNQDVVEMVFGDECKNRGFARRVIFAGVSTNRKDSNGEYMYTGDVIEVGENSSCSMKVALGTFKEDDHYRFILDNHSLFLSECREKLTRIGTVFFQLDSCEYPVKTIEQRTFHFNNCREDRQLLMLLAKFTPSFEQEIWKYQALELLGVEYHWNK